MLIYPLGSVGVALSTQSTCRYCMCVQMSSVVGNGE